jgi:signal peptidase II
MDDAVASPSRARAARRHVLFALIVAAVVADDQILKRLVERDLAGRAVRVAPGFDLRYARNPGAAWGLMADVRESVRRPFFLSVSLLAMAFVFYTYTRADATQRRLRLALALVFGGAAGNFIDRIAYGYVIDFVDWHVRLSGRDRHWPTFNIADAAITIGVILLAVEMWPRRAAAPAGADAPGGEPPVAP